MNLASLVTRFNQSLKAIRAWRRAAMFRRLKSAHVKLAAFAWAGFVSGVLVERAAVTSFPAIDLIPLFLAPFVLCWQAFL